MMRDEPMPVPTPAEWETTANVILSTGSHDDLLVIASIAGRVQLQALVQFGQTPAHDPKDDELLTTRQVVTEFKVSPHSVKEAIRRGRLEVWKPHPKAKRGFRVKRIIAKMWAGGESEQRRHR